MAGNKTVATDESVSAFIAAVDDERQRDEAQTLIDLCEELTGSPAKMWGSAIVGSGSLHVRERT